MIRLAIAVAEGVEGVACSLIVREQGRVGELAEEGGGLGALGSLDDVAGGGSECGEEDAGEDEGEEGVEDDEFFADAQACEDARAGCGWGGGRRGGIGGCGWHVCE